MPKRQDILQYCDEVLQTALFKDYAPNGLQVEGTEQVDKIITAVTASRAAIDYAATQNAQLLLVHHGMFWKSEPVTITGWKKQRIAKLLAHNINMAGYHLPLDAHPELGNNAQLAQLFDWKIEKRFGEQNLMNIGELPSSQNTLAKLLVAVAEKLGREAVFAGTPEQP
ncbi:Nif3-like dinuclear metal center hexameric protein, partial [Conchiformibius steedae]|uniref:Nif3-like dinuclear metal center hexameric protein n=1 Tax=Conchiformibius steedae TaxID=153493 RepID=UPI0026EF8C77